MKKNLDENKRKIGFERIAMKDGEQKAEEENLEKLPATTEEETKGEKVKKYLKLGACFLVGAVVTAGGFLIKALLNKDDDETETEDEAESEGPTDE